MKRNIKYVQFFLSPSGLLFLSMIPLAFSLLLPDAFYQNYVREKSYLHDGIAMPLFIVFCTFVVWFGAQIPSLFALPAEWSRDRIVWRQSPGAGPGRQAQITANLAGARPGGVSLRERQEATLTYVVVIMFCAGAILLNLYSLSVIIRQSGNLIALVLSGAGTLAKNNIDTEGSLSQAQPLLIAINGYALYRYYQFKNVADPILGRVLLMFVVTGICLSIVSSIAKVARYEVIPVMLTAGMTYFYFKYIKNEAPIYRALIYAFVVVGALVVVFSLFSVSRGVKSVDDLFVSLLGYGPAAYNHLAVLLNGDLKFTYAGTGSYALPFLAFVPFFEGLLHIREFLGMPPFVLTFLTQFTDTRAAELNGAFIWVTFYGYVFADFGWYTIFYLLVFGMLLSFSWRGFLKGNALGVMFYMFMAQSLLLSFSTNYFGRPAFITVLGAGLIVMFAERLSKLMLR